MADQWLSIVEYARQFNMSDMTVRRRIKTGKIQAVLREGKYYIPLSEALRKMANQSGANAQAAKPQPAQNLVKAHPVPERTYAPTPAEHHIPHQQHPHAHVAPRVAAPVPTPDFGTSPFIPTPLRQATVNHPSSVVESATLLAFCEAALKKAQEAEQRLEAHYRERVARLESEISQRDLQIKSLSQQVEDLQLLTKILEKKSRS
jgi:hypothetical protein